MKNNNIEMPIKSKINVVATGGTIEKIYDEGTGLLKNKKSIIKNFIQSQLRLPHTDFEVFPLLAKDSLDFNDEDRQLILSTLSTLQEEHSPIVVIHGTDTLEFSVQKCITKLEKVKVPVIFTGAMRPVDLKDSDAMQNIAESFIAAKLLTPGIYVSFHGQIFQGLNVHKNHIKGTFEYHH